MYSEPLTAAASGAKYDGAAQSGRLPEERLYVADASPAWRDPFCALAFYAHLLAILFFALFYGTKAISADAVSATACTTNCEDSQPYDLNSDIVIRSIVLAVFVGGLGAVVMLALLQRLGGALITSSIFLSIGVKAAVGAAFLGAGLFAPGITLLLMALFTAAYYSCIRARVRFAAAHVQLATLALRGAPDLIFLNLTLLLLQGIWSIVWGLAALGVEYAINNQGAGGQGAPAPADSDKGMAGTVGIFALLLSYFWVSGTIHNVAAFCAASVLGDWWWKGAAEARPVRGALTRAFTTSFGTITLGAFLVALCTVLKSAQRAAARRVDANGKAHPLAALACCMLGCLLAIVSAVAEWANQWGA
jgi:hypothetical protein